MNNKMNKRHIIFGIIFLTVLIIAVTFGILYYKQHTGGDTIEPVLNANMPYYQKGKDAILNLTESINDDMDWSLAVFMKADKERTDEIVRIDVLDGKMKYIQENIDGLALAVFTNKKGIIVSSSKNDQKRGYPFKIPFEQFGESKFEDNINIDGVLSEESEIIIFQSVDIKIHDEIYGKIYIAQHSNQFAVRNLTTKIVLMIFVVLCLAIILLVVGNKWLVKKENEANEPAEDPGAFPLPIEPMVDSILQETEVDSSAYKPDASVEGQEPNPSVQEPEPNPSVYEPDPYMAEQEPVVQNDNGELGPAGIISFPDTESPYVPEKLGQYNKIQQIFSGGMGDIHLATKDGMKTLYTIKTILNTYFDDDDFKKMFEKEAEIAESIKHRNIVGTYDYGIHDGTYYLVMEYIPGKNMFDIIKMLNLKTTQEYKKLTVSQTVFILMNISKGLVELHNRKIIHRDISLQNIMVSINGDVKIIDFGIAKTRTDPEKSILNVLKGKLPYLSPEQARREKLNEQTDIYSFGIIAYEFLFGRRLFYFNSEDEVRNYYTDSRIQVCPIDRIREDIPSELNMLIMKCLEQDRNKRYDSMSSVFEDLRAIKQGFSITYDESNLEEFMKKHFNDDKDIRRYLDSI